MKRFLPLLLAAALTLTGCAPVTGPSGRPSVYVSFYAMEDFTRTIAGGRADICTLVPPGSDPHGWEPTARDMEGLENADLFVYSGLGMEPFVPALRTAVESERLVWLEASSGVAPLDAGPGVRTDPHVWLDPNNALIEMRAIRDALTGIDPDGAGDYRDNYAKAEAQVLGMLGRYTEETKLFSRRELVVSHEAFGYLCAAFGLTQVALEGLQAEGEPTAARMAEIIDFVRENDVKVIYTEELVSPKTAETIAGETGAKTLTLSPFESGEKSYVDVMLDNLAALHEGLD